MGPQGQSELVRKNRPARSEPLSLLIYPGPSLLLAFLKPLSSMRVYICVDQTCYGTMPRIREDVHCPLPYLHKNTQNTFLRVDRLPVVKRTIYGSVMMEYWPTFTARVAGPALLPRGPQARSVQRRTEWSNHTCLAARSDLAKSTLGSMSTRNKSVGKTDGKANSQLNPTQFVACRLSTICLRSSDDVNYVEQQADQ